jgi:hypothetical protein
MSTHYMILVVSDVNLDLAKIEAERMLIWLQDRKIVGAGQRQGDICKAWLGKYLLEENSTLTSNDTIVYQPGEHSRNVCLYDTPGDTFDNWLEVVIERTVFHAGEGGIQIFCPQCQTEQVEQGADWSTAVQTWFNGGEENLACVNCNYRAPLSGWRFDPPWGFGNLGFSFSNWVLKSEFIEEFAKELGRPVTVVRQHL